MIVNSPSDGRPTKWCPQCKTFLYVGYFYVNHHKADGLSSWCRVCNQARMKIARKRDYAIRGDEIRALARSRQHRLYRENPEKFRQRARENRETYRKAVFDHYGWSCSCCGESTEAFLTIDHVNGDGASHRKALNNQITLYAWLCKNRMPSGFQTLCRNCNFGKGQGKECPCKTTDYSKFIGACG